MSSIEAINIMAGIKYSWWADRPKNVSRKEYEHYQFVQFGMVGLGGIASICFITVLTSLVSLGSDPWGEIEPLTVAGALEKEGDRSAYLFQGRLIADPPAVMPDDPNLNIVAASIQLTASEEGIETATLWEWKSTDKPLFLEQDQKRIPFKLDPSILPMKEDRLTRPDLIYEGDSPRFRQLVAVEYNGDRYPLPAAFLQLNETPTIKLNRQYFINGQNIVLVAGLESQDGTPQLVPPLGQKAQLWVGTPDQVTSRPWASLPIRIVFGLGCAIGCYLFSQKYMILRQEIIQKSNATS